MFILPSMEHSFNKINIWQTNMMKLIIGYRDRVYSGKWTIVLIQIINSSQP